MCCAFYRPSNAIVFLPTMGDRVRDHDAYMYCLDPGTRHMASFTLSICAVDSCGWRRRMHHTAIVLAFSIGDRLMQMQVPVCGVL